MREIKPQGAPVRENEIVLKDNGDWLHFAQPHRILTADCLADVLPALNELERLVDANGWFAAGFLSYEAAAAFDAALETVPGGEGFPLLWFGLYPKPHLMTLPQPTPGTGVLDWRPGLDRGMYNAAVERVKKYIAEGLTYQVNYTMRLKTEFSGNAWEFFLNLAQQQNNQAAYVDTGRYVICSASPELFFQLDGEAITCRPMKGTTRRGRTTAEDKKQADWLRNSVKNRAENVMILDMIRNDLGRIAETGSVHVPVLFHIERYPSLWQMTSTVAAKTSASLTEIFTALFPCASITGAPKVSTMKIIAKLESTPRRIYTGSIGYIAPGRKAIFNVAIRTALIDRKQQKAEYGVGGGIVWDSNSPDEYAEALLKARVLAEQTPAFSLLETLLWTPEAGFFLCEKHIARMLDSAHYFDIQISKQELERYLGTIGSGFHSAQRTRVILSKDGKLASQSSPIEPEDGSESLVACLAPRPVDSADVFLFHKTTRRAVYEDARAGSEKFDDVLLYNEAGELTEFTIGNLVVELDGQLLTPPVACGVLPGTFRAYLLETGQVLERILRVEHLKNCGRVFRVNAVRKWQRVNLVVEQNRID
jgi:para-aminobenzoate synthetase/4-amino-4-deoxychorismate lyase